MEQTHRHEDAQKIQFRPGVCVRVTQPTNEHEEHQGDTGVINDVREVGSFIWCQVFLRQAATMVYFDWMELDLDEVIPNTGQH